MWGKRLAAMACLPLTFACKGHRNSDTPSAEVRDSAGVRIVENHTARLALPWRVNHVPSLTIGSVEGDEDYDLHQVTGALRLGGGTVVVANSGTLELRFYDREGRHLRSVGGPGEFQSLEWISRFTSD